MQTQPVEDIEAVLGRFQAWAGSRNAVEVKPGVRELSCDEALQSRRYRWKTAGESSAKKNPDALSQPEPVRQKAARARSHDAKQKTAKKVRARNHAAHADRKKDITPAAKAVPVAKAEPKARSEAKPAFRDVLAEAVGPIELMVAAQPVELARQVAISIRLAPAERALMKTRAAEAGISVSAYIRQCALEVEQLRGQVRQTLAAMERRASAPEQTPRSVPVPAPVVAPGFFSRLARRFFPGTGRTLALRA